MDQERWDALDEYLGATLLPHDPVFEDALRAAEEAGVPPISVSPLQGMLLHVLVRAVGARRVLEIGTLAGYSGIWMARGLPEGGRLTTLEVDPRHAAVAQANFSRAGVAASVDLRLGPALESLARIEAEGGGPFDLVFVDADKETYPEYVRWALRLTKPGSLLVVDNVVRAGRVADARDTDPVVAGTRGAVELIGAEPRLAATALQIVGSKGHDGLAIALVTA